MKEVNYKFRKPELEQYRPIFLTKKAYDILRKQKEEQKLSMAKILDNLILDKYDQSPTRTND